MIQPQLPQGLWTKTLLITCYLVNLSPSIAIDFKTPFKVWYVKLENYNELKVFDCMAYAHINQGKLALRALNW